MYNTPAHTNMKAKNVPTLVKSTKKSILKNSAGTATIKPATTVAKEGVLYFGCMVAKRLQSKPSRLMVIHIRGWASWKTNNALVMATTEVTETIPAR